MSSSFQHRPEDLRIWNSYYNLIPSFCLFLLCCDSKSVSPFVTISAKALYISLRASHGTCVCNRISFVVFLSSIHCLTLFWLQERFEFGMPFFLPRNQLKVFEARTECVLVFILHIFEFAFFHVCGAKATEPSWATTPVLSRNRHVNEWLKRTVVHVSEQMFMSADAQEERRGSLIAFISMLSMDSSGHHLLGFHMANWLRGIHGCDGIRRSNLKWH